MKVDEFKIMRNLSVAAFDNDPAIGTLIDTLRSSWAWEDALSFVAVRSDQIIGHVLYSHAFVDAPRSLVKVLVLSPIGVRPDLQGQQIGTRLIEKSLAILRTRPEPLVFLEGNPEYYRRFEFQPAGNLGFAKPSVRIPDAAFMVHPLPAYEPWMTGRLVYSDAFWQTDTVGLRDD